MRTEKCCRKCGQALFALLNMTFFTIGAMLLSVGIYLAVTDNSLSLITGDRIVSGALILIMTGIITIIVAIFGIFGSLILSRWLLLIYAISMTLVILIELSLGILGFVFKDNLAQHVADSVSSAIQQYQGDNATEIIDIFQEGFSCCGYNGPNDWENTEFMNTSILVVPRSCHCDPNVTLACNETFKGYPNLYIWEKGCNTALLAIIDEYSVAIGVVATLFAGFQVVGIILAICNCALTRRKQHMDLVVPNKLMY